MRRIRILLVVAPLLLAFLTLMGKPAPAQASVAAPGKPRTATTQPVKRLVKAAPPAAAPARAGATPQSNVELSTNLQCVAFVPGNGPNARSSLVNRCGEAIRLNYCLIQAGGADNCAPMSVGWQATQWDLRAGQALGMPAADALKLLSVYACKAPLHPMRIRFAGGRLGGGACAEDGLEPLQDDLSKIVRSNDPTSWPGGIANKPCIRTGRQLDRALSVQLVSECPTGQKVAVCQLYLPPNSGPDCRINWTSLNETTSANRWVTNLGRPNGYTLWAAFACDAPLEPADLKFDGIRLTGYCKDPNAPQVLTRSTNTGKELLDAGVEQAKAWEDGRPAREEAARAAVERERLRQEAFKRQQEEWAERDRLHQEQQAQRQARDNQTANQLLGILGAVAGAYNAAQQTYSQPSYTQPSYTPKQTPPPVSGCTARADICSNIRTGLPPGTTLEEYQRGRFGK